MPYSSLIDLQSISAPEVLRIFTAAKAYQQLNFKNEAPNCDLSHSIVGAVVFFEPSTRTRLSFEMACHRMGLQFIGLHGRLGTSLEKGESFEDTLANIAAMGPNFFIIRCGDDLDLPNLEMAMRVPIINAGWGQKGHPTQALLDVFTLWTEGRDLSQERLLICGDIKHSRVAKSHIELARILGLKFSICAPQELNDGESEVKSYQFFDSLDEGLKWASSALFLRAQTERHQQSFQFENYHMKWGLTRERLAQLPQNFRVLHPGPVHWGMELDKLVLNHSTCRILNQVQGGVSIRQAVIQRLLGKL